MSAHDPLLLALDTSTSVASVALFDGRQVVSETTWLAGREHSTRLLIEVQSAFERVARTTDDLTGLVVARGPGSFTGVRVALSVAKGLAVGLTIPVWGINTLDAVAASVAPVELPVRAVVEAGRGRFATALYLRGVALEPPMLATPQQLAAMLTEPTVVVGEVSEEARATLEEQPAVRLAPRSATGRRAGFLAELGWRLAQAGEPGDASSLDALYAS